MKSCSTTDLRAQIKVTINNWNEREKKRRVNCWVQYQICKIVIFGMRYGNVIAVPIRLHAWTTEKYHIAFRRRTLVNWMKQRAWMSCYYREFVWSYIYRSDSIKCNKCSWKKTQQNSFRVWKKKTRINANYFIWVLVIKK